eukprot:2451422-Lingulodinium_polyedra.AAC.1
MLVDPKTLRVLAATTMNEPEGNAIARESLVKVLHLYSNVNLYVMDRVCGFAPSAKCDPQFKQIKYYSVDWLHAKTHTETCAHNPWRAR